MEFLGRFVKILAAVASKWSLYTKFFVDTTNTFVVIIVSMKRPPQKPTPSELEILRILWDRGPSTVREVHDALSEEKHVGYTSVLKFLQIMTAKGLVRRNESQRAHVYEACLPAEQTKRQLAGDLLQRVFEGSASQLIMHALAGRKASRDEIEELRRLLHEYERSRR
jgi:BlaI family transcriptional regulator, penicillinase repressor